MICSFKHKGLKEFYEKGSLSGILPKHKNRLRFQLAALDTATEIADMNIPGFKLHPLKGARRGQWAISVSGNWRISFELVQGNIFNVDYEDYH